MVNITIITSQTHLTRGFNDFYPIFKWKKEFLDQGIKFRFCNSFESLKSNSEIVILDYRYISSIGDRVETDREKIIQKVESIKKYSKVILFDSADGVGSRCFWLTPFVDIHLKKQLLIDKSLYTSSEMTASYMPWIPGNIIKEVFKDDHSYVGCPENQLDKLQIAWNIGYVDYRQFPFDRYYPTSIIPRFLSSGPKITQPSINRPVFVSYRGGANTSPHYSYQRNKVIDALVKMNSQNASIIVGGKISKSEYIKESKNSKVMISPFGWGEVCYRDFECFINGSLLIKPDMSHLETFPNIFTPNETYIPINWELTDLEEVLEQVFRNYPEYLDIAQNAQKRFIDHTNNFELFLNKIQELTK
jgi:hypothetical protein